MKKSIGVPNNSVSTFKEIRKEAREQMQKDRTTCRFIGYSKKYEGFYLTVQYDDNVVFIVFRSGKTIPVEDTWQSKTFHHELRGIQRKRGSKNQYED